MANGRLKASQLQKNLLIKLQLMKKQLPYRLPTLKRFYLFSIGCSGHCAATSLPLFTTAEEALKKAKELDTKGENKKMIDEAYLNLAQYQLTKGVKEYSEAVNMTLLTNHLIFTAPVLPEDTNAIYYTGLLQQTEKIILLQFQTTTNW
jgi:hypothetical protein